MSCCSFRFDASQPALEEPAARALRVDMSQPALEMRVCIPQSVRSYILFQRGYLRFQRGRVYVSGAA